jgi:hypothetical protein
MSNPVNVYELYPVAEQTGVDGRTFDQALWQWSKEQDVLLY